MNAAAGVVLPLLAVAVGAWAWGWQGAVLGVTVVVFALLLQFGRAVRTLKQAAARPKGSVASAVTLHARLHAGMRLPQVLRLTGSLGFDDTAGIADAADGGDAGQTASTRAAADEERYRWVDGGGDTVHVRLRGGRVADWRLARAVAPGP